MNNTQLPKRYYRIEDGREPAKDFIAGLDKAPRAKVWVQIDRSRLVTQVKGTVLAG